MKPADPPSRGCGVETVEEPGYRPSLGISSDPLQLVPERMPDGGLPKYIEMHPGSDRLSFVGWSSHYVRSQV